MNQKHTQTNEPVLPVTTFENEEVKGMALCNQSLFEDELTKIQQARDRQSDYLASLPTDASKCLSAALKVLHPKGDEFPEGLEAALHLSFALAPMIRHLQTDDAGPERDALLYIADQVNSGLMRAARKIEHVSAILGNPTRIEREARIARQSN